jgi:UDP-glucuronate 4-epimerase
VLLEQGHRVIAWDNLTPTYDVRMKEWRLAQLQGQPGYHYERLDISDWQAVQQASKDIKPDGIINLAARAGVRASVEDPWDCIASNTTGALNMLELCRRFGSKMIQASTSSIYGATPPLPTPETASSDTPLQPYAASKKGAEAMAYTYHFLHGVDVTVFRFFTVYGPAGRPDMSMFRFAQWIAEGRPLKMFGTGEQTRGFTYVDDIVRGILLGLKPLGYEIINLGGHEVISMHSLIQMIEELVGRPANIIYSPANPADAMANCADVTKARSLLGWEPQVGLLEGVKNLFDWYLAERSWAAGISTE